MPRRTNAIPDSALPTGETRHDMLQTLSRRPCLERAAIQCAIDHDRKSVTIVCTGSIIAHLGDLPLRVGFGGNQVMALSARQGQPQQNFGAEEAPVEDGEGMIGDACDQRLGVPDLVLAPLEQKIKMLFSVN